MSHQTHFKWMFNLIEIGRYIFNKHNFLRHAAFKFSHPSSSISPFSEGFSLKLRLFSLRRQRRRYHTMIRWKNCCCWRKISRTCVTAAVNLAILVYYTQQTTTRSLSCDVFSLFSSRYLLQILLHNFRNLCMRMVRTSIMYVHFTKIYVRFTAVAAVAQ